MAIGDIYLVTIKGTMASGDVLNTIHFRETATGAGNPSQLLASGIDGRVSLSWRPLLSQDYTYSYTQAQKIAPGLITMPAIANLGAGVGGKAVNALPACAAITVTKQTALAGRFYRGRIYMSGISEDDETGGQLNAGLVTTFETSVSNMFAVVTTGGWAWNAVLWHKAGGSYSDITNWRVNRPIRNQRRRQFGKGS